MLTLLNRFLTGRGAWIWWLGLSLNFATGTGVSAAQDNLLAVLAELLRSPDRDTRGLALQQVRHSVPGENVTVQLTGLLPSLDPDGQCALLEALGERGDPAARPAILRACHSASEAVRVSALGALVPFAEPDDVPLFAGRLGSASAAERQAATRALVRCSGKTFTQAILKALENGDPARQSALLAILAERKDAGAVAGIVRCLPSTEKEVRIAALLAASSLAGPSEPTILIGALLTAEATDERHAAEAALTTLAGRHREPYLEAVLNSWPRANAEAQLSLLRILAALGGDKALTTVAAAAQHASSAVQDEAWRLLSNWPDPAAGSLLLEFGQGTSNPVYRSLAVRGVIRLARPDDTQPGNAQWLAEAWKLAAAQPADQRLVLGASGGVPALETLALAELALTEAQVTDEAALACVLIAEQLATRHPRQSRDALKLLLERNTNAEIRDRAQHILTRLEPGH